MVFIFISRRSTGQSGKSSIWCNDTQTVSEVEPVHQLFDRWGCWRQARQSLPLSSLSLSLKSNQIKSNEVYLYTTFFENDSGVFTVQEINFCERNFRPCFGPSQKLSVDEVMIQFDGRLSWKQYQASNLTAARQIGNLPPCLGDWPQCLVNETIVYGQTGRALFRLQITSNSQRFK